MNRHKISRRRFLAVSALPAMGVAAGSAGLGALSIASARAVRAFSFEQADGEVSAQYLKAHECLQTPNAYHQQLADEVREMLRGRDVDVSDDEIRLAVAQTTCPLCGCPLET